MNVVFLDSDTLPLNLLVPEWVTDWQDRAATSADQVVQTALHAHVLITNKVRIGREELEQLPNLRFICVAATGYDCIDLVACREHGVQVSNVPAYSAQSVAESVIASVFNLRRQLLAYRHAARHDWPTSRHFCVHRQPIQDVQGSVLGIVGKGAIGLATARLASALGMRLLFAEHRGVTAVRQGYQAFETVLAQSDVISLHCPLTEHNRHLIGAAELAQMKPGALLINTARGPLVDELAVLEALNRGRLGGAALDVLCEEPPPAAHPLLNSRHPSLIVTPHVAWASQSSLQRLADGILANLHGYYAGSLINRVA
ncbi:D-2-hydroxyacid dehydrogenase [Pseudomonas costantinii]|uniref:D-2-hydroxyacid dehydrogenase n=1 Tax=Pseudomonas costantinii TaxID=168469 RepID=UPI00159F8B29|nr:D-2-hydroxyacid dehydrogenase [Pseudomonas costantinii]NVZ71869.1 D-2-hydroxyacid dehydrogenase [Pseudomonas costantinii]